MTTVTSRTSVVLPRTDDLDRARMRRERLAKVQEGMAANGFDALVLSGNSAVRYATGSEMMHVEISRNAYDPTIAIVLPTGLPHLFTPYPEGAAPEIPSEHVHGPLLVEFDEGVDAFAGALADLVGPGQVHVGFDDLAGAVMERFPTVAPNTKIGDAGTVLGAAKILKTPDEVECIRRAQSINESAMYDVYAALKAGVRQTDLSGILLRRIFELGASGNHVDPIWQAMARSIGAGPYTVHGDVAFPLNSTDAILRDGDLVMVDSGIIYEGYASDFGRTWLVGRPPTPREVDQCKRWQNVVAEVLAITRPGTTGLELNRAARAADSARRPWLEHFYLIHGIGTDSAEMPFIGTDLGEEFDESIVLAPGMVMVLEPVIWDDGEGGYRSEEVVVVTDDGYRCLSHFPYMPFDEGTVAW
jgi:Xaa-Pro aminopeptidase